MGLKSGVCPQCGSDEIFVNRKQKKTITYGNAILVKLGWLHTWSHLRHYFCANCGYMESYLADGESIQHLLEVSEPLNKEKRKNE